MKVSQEAALSHKPQEAEMCHGQVRGSRGKEHRRLKSQLHTCYPIALRFTRNPVWHPKGRREKKATIQSKVTQ